MAGWAPNEGTAGLSQAKVMADINVTPMVDVMLVLLVIFMVTAPLLVAGVPVELPKNAAQPISQSKKPLVVTFAADRGLFIRDEKVDDASLVRRLSELRQAEGDAILFVRADRKIPYGDVMEILGRLGASGYSRISLLSQSQKQEALKPAPEPAVNREPTVR